eukprot:SAG11_NODE_20260_length_449_cov_0.957143_1_plen_61_part_00
MHMARGLKNGHFQNPKFVRTAVPKYLLLRAIMHRTNHGQRTAVRPYSLYSCTKISTHWQV